jgi:hypothetical protein
MKCSILCPFGCGYTWLRGGGGSGPVGPKSESHISPKVGHAMTTRASQPSAAWGLCEQICVHTSVCSQASEYASLVGVGGGGGLCRALRTQPMCGPTQVPDVGCTMRSEGEHTRGMSPQPHPHTPEPHRNTCCRWCHVVGGQSQGVCVGVRACVCVCVCVCVFVILDCRQV